MINKTIVSEKLLTKLDFGVFFKDFERKFGPSNVGHKEIYDDINASHQDIRKLFGGTTLIKNITLDTETAEVPSDVIFPLEKDLLCQIGKYFHVHELNLGSFSSPYVRTNKIQDGNMRWGKHIQSWIEAENKKFAGTDEEIPEDVQKIVLKTLSQMGDMWAKFKQMKVAFNIILTTDPRAFPSLGYFFVDGGSCFKSGGGHAIERFVLGNTKNSFVGIITKPDLKIESFDDILEVSQMRTDRNEGSILARFFGVADERYNNFYVGNMYHVNQEKNRGSFTMAISEFLEDLNSRKYKVGVNQTVVKGIFQNKEHWLFSSGALGPSETVFKGHEIVGNTSNIAYSRCTICSDMYTPRKMGKSESERNICVECVNNLPVCEYSGKNVHPSRMIKAMNKDGKHINISRDLLNDSFFTDVFTNKHFHKSRITNISQLGYVSDESMEVYKAQIQPYLKKKSSSDLPV